MMEGLKKVARCCRASKEKATAVDRVKIVIKAVAIQMEKKKVDGEVVVAVDLGASSWGIMEAVQEMSGVDCWKEKQAQKNLSNEGCLIRLFVIKIHF